MTNTIKTTTVADIGQGLYGVGATERAVIEGCRGPIQAEEHSAWHAVSATYTESVRTTAPMAAGRESTCLPMCPPHQTASPLRQWEPCLLQRCFTEDTDPAQRSANGDYSEKTMLSSKLILKAISIACSKSLECSIRSMDLSTDCICLSSL